MDGRLPVYQSRSFPRCRAKGGRGWIGASTTGWPKESRRLSISMRGSAARSIVGGIVGEECPRCRGSVQAEAAFAVRRHESKSNVITFESEHPPRISNLRRFFEASGRSSCSSSDFNSRRFQKRNYSLLYIFRIITHFFNDRSHKGKNNLWKFYTRINCYDNFFEPLIHIIYFCKKFKFEHVKFVQLCKEGSNYKKRKKMSFFIFFTILL